MRSSKTSIHRIVMAKNLASQWLDSQIRPEYRLTVYYVGKEARGMPSLLRGFRDARVRIGSLVPIPDLGVKEDFDSVEVWSSDREAMLKLAAWFEEHDYDTSGVW